MCIYGGFGGVYHVAGPQTVEYMAYRRGVSETEEVVTMVICHSLTQMGCALKLMSNIILVHSSVQRKTKR